MLWKGTESHRDKGISAIAQPYFMCKTADFLTKLLSIQWAMTLIRDRLVKLVLQISVVNWRREYLSIQGTTCSVKYRYDLTIGCKVLSSCVKPLSVTMEYGWKSSSIISAILWWCTAQGSLMLCFCQQQLSTFYAFFSVNFLSSSSSTFPSLHNPQSAPSSEDWLKWKCSVLPPWEKIRHTAKWGLHSKNSFNTWHH